MIRTIRKLLRGLLLQQKLTDESLTTLMCEVEAIINSRPLTFVSDDPNEPYALTPSHLLTLRPPLKPISITDKSDTYSRKRWRQVQYLSDVFWQRWKREYLPLLQERQKWSQVKRNLAPGDIVLVIDDTLPRCSW